MNSLCTVVQERIVASQTLDEAEQAHVLGCAGCSRFAADCLALDSMVADSVDGALSIPSDFADRVMAKLEQVDPDRAQVRRWEDLFGRRWVQVAIANVGVVFAVANLVRFVFSALLPTAALGGTP
jgi:hypothetical protein